ncbi:Start control protein-like protein [Emericellopsis cladophorae]|uniref:Transcription factor SWI6 n=1 Tax=Emericellopsis cladophorae TaxID=2686198 RepID=A0A9Q0BGY4_9HYPO|nr:Start control protein-like protein [Emericellopsis cladophorae]KAI6785507.1 Start control protein-like protein [Emericellopsis cladophorae]
MSQQSQPGAMGTASFNNRSFANNMSTTADPQIFTASYSTIDVYEMEVNGIAVMRRRHDSWLNATQILKVAGVEKGKRTKILEKEIQTGEHEKVQGGYGKYQGTWIKFERGVQVCRQYGVEEVLRPLLEYDMGQDGGVAGGGNLNTPTKEQAMAAQRKRLYNSGADTRTSGLSGTFFKNISSTASHAVAAISKARFDSPGPRSRNGPTRAPSFQRQTSMQNPDEFPGNSQQSYVSDQQQQPESAYSTQTQQMVGSQETEPPRKRQRTTMTPVESFNGSAGYGQNMDIYATAFPGSPTEPNESFVYTQQQPPHDQTPDDEQTGGALPPLAYEMSPDMEHKRGLLMGLFMEDAGNDTAKHEMLRAFAPAELDMPIDAQSHTALHWAATLSRMPLLRALIAAGASPHRVNNSGETALMRACLVTNSMDHGSFPDLLEYLGATIDARDHKGRTVLHHIAFTSAVKGRSAASRYYLESLLEWVVRQGSNPSTSVIPKMGIARFMSEIVNDQDSSGDTALNIAARIGNRSIVSQLLEVGADPMIANRADLKPLDFGVGGQSEEEKMATQQNGELSNGVAASSKTRESSDEIIASITHLVTETSTSFHQELKAKQQSVDALHSQLRSTSSQLGEARRQHENLTATLKKQQVARQIISNLAQSRQEDQLRTMQDARDTNLGSWETELSTILESNSADFLPSAHVLKARIQALQNTTNGTRAMVNGLKSRSRDVEVKYRKVVALCTGVKEEEVDAVIDGLIKAVESERDGLDMGRVRRFLGGVEGVVH